MSGLLGATTPPLPFATVGEPSYRAKRASRVSDERRICGHPSATFVIDEVASAGKHATRQDLIAPVGEVLAAYLPIEDAGHAWSGGDGAGSFTDPDGPDASHEMARFFLRS